MNRVRLLTPWAAYKPAAYFPKVLLDHPFVANSLESHLDVSNQPALPSPNVHVVELQCSDTTLAAIQTDANYASGILWINDGSVPPTAVAYANLVSFLNAVSGATVVVAGLAPANTQYQNEAAITVWTRTLALSQ